VVTLVTRMRSRTSGIATGLSPSGCRTLSVIFEPIGPRNFLIAASMASDCTGTPSIATITSPGSTPARLAGPPSIGVMITN
jgi:hypothetical protein